MVCCARLESSEGHIVRRDAVVWRSCIIAAPEAMSESRTEIKFREAFVVCFLCSNSRRDQSVGRRLKLLKLRSIGP